MRRLGSSGSSSSSSRARAPSEGHHAPREQQGSSAAPSPHLPLSMRSVSASCLQMPFLFAFCQPTTFLAQLGLFVTCMLMAFATYCAWHRIM